MKTAGIREVSRKFASDNGIMYKDAEKYVRSFLEVVTGFLIDDEFEGVTFKHYFSLKPYKRESVHPMNIYENPGSTKIVTQKYPVRYPWTVRVRFGDRIKTLLNAHRK